MYAEISVALVRADDKAAGFGNGKVHTRERRVGSEKALAEVLPGRFGEVLRIGRANLRAQLLMEKMADLLLFVVDGGHHDVARWLLGELHDALAQIRVHHVDPMRFEVWDLLFTRRCTPFSCKMPCTIRLCSSASCAQCT